MQTPANLPAFSAEPETLLQQAWLARFSHELEVCFARVWELKLLLGIPSEPPEALAQESARLDQATARLWVELFLLEGSLARARLDAGLSARWLDLAERTCQKHAIRPLAQTVMQRALNSFLAGHFSPALEGFARARLLQKMEREARLPVYFDVTATALLNSLLCLENLGLSFSKTQVDLRLAIADPDSGEPFNLCPNLAEQLRAFEVRTAFRHGELEPFQSQAVRSVNSQADFTLLWVRSLPYLKLREEQGPLSQDLAHLHLGSFRLRTIAGLVSPEDGSCPSASDPADRIYLWLWRWMSDPHRYSFDRIRITLERTAILENLHRLTADDQAELRLCFQWLTLLEPSLEPWTVPLIQRLGSPRAQEHAVFSIESLLLHSLRARKLGRALEQSDCEALLRSHPLWSSGALRFQELWSREHCPWPQWRESLLEISVSDSSGALLLVDLDQNRITRHATGESTLSDILCAALALLSKSGFATGAQLLETCFGLSRYDSGVHDRKIHNLLARLKALFPKEEIQFKFRAGKVYAEGDWSLVKWFRPSPYAEQIRASGLREYLAQFQAREKRERTIAYLGPEPAAVETALAGVPKRALTRGELEALLKRPRSTTNRLIVSWERDGLLKREGQSRNTRYVLGAKLARQLTEARK